MTDSISAKEQCQEFTIRKFRDRDLPAIYSLEQEVFEHPWPRSAFLYVAKSNWGRGGEIILMETNVENSPPILVGYSCMTWEKGIGHILNLGVSKAFRAKKLGERLLLATLERFRDKKLSIAVLEVRISNTIAQRLYEKHGFQVHHVEMSYYPDGEDGLVMVLPLKGR
ncbi:MAG: GNAT family N-acetyltransferase [Candidatus Coatesbacteria bacterium]|nr:GNAT family N-acetyltransferase [Candidatus Coatesbacteria bacterium]